MPDVPELKSPYRRVVAALAESEERYRTLVEGVRQYAIFMLDPDGRIMTWNRGIHELLGYDRDEVVGESGEMVFNAGDRAAGLFKKELAKAKRYGESMIEHSNRCKDGREIRVHDTATSLLNSEGRLIGFAKVARRVDGAKDAAADTAALELAKALARVQVEVEHRRRLETQLLTAVEEERERLGRDLHDDLSQRLAGIAMMMDSIGKQLPRGADETKLRDIARLLNDAVAVARNLSRGLHPVTLTTHGLPAALAELAERVPTEVEFKLPQSARLDIDRSVALHVYRIAEEAVGNAIRHSESQKIRIELRTKPARTISLSISDDGKGFEARTASAGMGFQNMRYRAAAVGGALEITSTAGSGTSVTCSFPLTARLGAERAAPSGRKASNRKREKPATRSQGKPR
ncbi:MAG: hypothetical protein DLM52_12685 [Chthoniobacterales bacterium]|nr:MAG: hypothetical protein DLM52_12685 [Chthoniobacterales bacterium]